MKTILLILTFSCSHAAYKTMNTYQEHVRPNSLHDPRNSVYYSKRYDERGNQLVEQPMSYGFRKQQNRYMEQLEAREKEDYLISRRPTGYYP